MVSDDERRLVAERLRMSDERDAAGFVDCLLAEVVRGREFCETPCEECHARLLGELADLIEPSIPADPGEAGLACVDAFIREHTEKPVDRDTPQKVAEEMFGKMRHSTKEEADAYDAMLKSKSVERRPIDRDALLALADEIEYGASSDDGEYHDLPAIMVAAVARKQVDYARRIREACGEVDA